MNPQILLAVTVGLASEGALVPDDTACWLERCPRTSPGWTIFPDSSPGAPDFWWETVARPVLEISSCVHGVQFLFRAVHGGQERTTALVFPNPRPALIAKRVGLEPGSEAHLAETAHYQGRFLQIHEGLRGISGGVFRPEVELKFDDLELRSRPSIVFTRQLEITWEEETLPLRGYLDVWFGPEPVVLAALDSEEGEDVASSDSARRSAGRGDGPDRLRRDAMEGVRLAPGVGLPTATALGVSPNPGRTAAYRISFAVARPGPVVIRVYDVAGRTVATALNSLWESHGGEILWKARSTDGGSLASGVYFVRLETPEGAPRTRKLVHLGP